MRLIDADALQERLLAQIMRTQNKIHKDCYSIYAFMVKDIPTVKDAVQVVRCAYCKHCFDMGNDPMEPYDGESEWYCERFDRDTSAYEIDPYRFFCADGERRDDDAAD